MPQSLDDLEQQRSAILDRMTELGDFRPGSITTTSGRCGKANCRCHRPDEPPHGPTERLTYKIDGKHTEEIPAQDSGFERIEPILVKLPGWQSQTFGIDNYDQLPPKAKSYLAFVEKETGAKVGIVSTGPDRDDTIILSNSWFEHALKS